MKSKLKFGILLAAGVLASGQAFAVQKGGLCMSISSSISSNTTPIICPFLGEVTIDQIYERGYRVVTVFLLNPKDRLSSLGVIIEEQNK